MNIQNIYFHRYVALLFLSKLTSKFHYTKTNSVSLIKGIEKHWATYTINHMYHKSEEANQFFQHAP